MKKLYPCSCYAEGIVLEREDDTKDMLYMAFWQQGFSLRAPSIKEKLRWIFHILKTGEFWTDEVILNKEEAITMANDILEMFNDHN